MYAYFYTVFCFTSQTQRQVQVNAYAENRLAQCINVSYSLKKSVIFV